MVRGGGGSLCSPTRMTEAWRERGRQDVHSQGLTKVKELRARREGRADLGEGLAQRRVDEVLVRRVGLQDLRV
jgi:hypothetical protein